MRGWHGLVSRKRAALAVGVVIATAAIVAAAGVGFGNDTPGRVGSDLSGLERSDAAPVITPEAVSPDATLAGETLGESAPMGASVPVRLTIPSIGVDTTLMDLGLLPDGTLEVPPDGTLAGWFTGAPTPGELGPAVIAGHVDWNGPGVFFDLGKVAVGDLIEVTRADGSVAVFAATEVRTFPKAEFPTEEVYGALTFAGLRLITCGGVFDDTVGHYEDNVVVFAELASSTGSTVP